MLYFLINNVTIMVIIFGNQKGGVGKTTLCTLFANHLAKMGKKTLVVDCDNQQTISEKRKLESKNKPEAKFLYNVQTFNIANVENAKNLMKELRTLDGVVLIDAPGNLAQQGLIPLFVNADFVVCPFQFESTSVNSTVTFILFIIKLKEKFPQMKAQLFFVVNRHDKRYGKKQELLLWSNTEKSFGQYGFVAPRVEAKADMQRYNTLEVSDKQKEIVGPTFDFICNKIFEEDKP